MKTVAILQARLRSTRLPGKVLLPLPSGRTILEEVIWRCREATRVHQVVVAIPDTEECDLLMPFTGGAAVVRGPEKDVLERFRRAASHAGADVVVRVTTDCPAVPSELIDAVIAQRHAHALAYCCNNMPRTFPHGFDVEVFSARALYWHAENTWDPESREHVTAALRRSVEGASHVNVACSEGDFSHLRWTVDDLDDYVRVCRVFEGAKGASNLLEVVKR